MARRRFDDTYEEESVPGTWEKQKKWIIIFGIAIIAWYLARGTRGFSSFDNVDLLMFGGVMLYLLGKGFDAEIKLHSPAVICDPISSTFNGMVYEFGNWKAIRLGGANWGFYQAPGSDGTILFPSTAILKRGANADIAGTAQWLPVESIPIPLRTQLEELGMPRPFYIAFAEPKILQHVPDLKFLIEEYLNTNQYAFRLQKLNDSIMKQIEHKEKWTDRIRNVRRPKDTVYREY